MAKNATRTALVPSDTVEANAFLGRIAEIERTVAEVETLFADEVAKLRKNLGIDDRLGALNAELLDRAQGLEVFATKHREDLLKDGGKTVKLPLGSFGWRIASKAKVLHGRIKEETIIARIKEVGKAFTDKYIRAKEELNKEAMIADRPAIKGVTYSQPEKFFYETEQAVNDEEASSNVVELATKAA